jgi:hypothetical protein
MRTKGDGTCRLGRTGRSATSVFLGEQQGATRDRRTRNVRSMQGNVSATSVRPDRHLVFPMARNPLACRWLTTKKSENGGCGRLTRG